MNARTNYRHHLLIPLGACALAMNDEEVDRFVNALARVLSRE